MCYNITLNCDKSSMIILKILFVKNGILRTDQIWLKNAFFFNSTINYYLLLRTCIQKIQIYISLIKTHKWEIYKNWIILSLTFRLYDMLITQANSGLCTVRFFVKSQRKMENSSLFINPVGITSCAKCSQVRSIASLEFETQMRNSPRFDNVKIPAKITWRVRAFLYSTKILFSRGRFTLPRWTLMYKRRSFCKRGDIPRCNKL